MTGLYYKVFNFDGEPIELKIYSLIIAKNIKFSGILESPTMGIKYWFVNGEYHRIDGPAVEYKDGYTEYYINDEEIYPKNIESFKLYVDLLKLKGLI